MLDNPVKRRVKCCDSMTHSKQYQNTLGGEFLVINQNKNRKPS